ncbi:uncharacterized protein TNIN_263981 [Trichonephila inaurata madagascariensis]|uniref:Uncharacterized protein n=1 Tax=Trichonephila inaurata madagascariensis TaxID=2747483 RepID=A0A8X6MJP4_9ARAC|nr:uncharacterized protein TNIN_263981 [Trichonephila inaurata madagascariensis]
MAHECCDCCKVPLPGMFINPLDEYDKIRLYNGFGHHWRWTKDPRGKPEFHPPVDVYAPEYQFYSKRFSQNLNLSRDPDYGRTEDMTLRLNGYGPKTV